MKAKKNTPSKNGTAKVLSERAQALSKHTVKLTVNVDGQDVAIALMNPRDFATGSIGFGAYSVRFNVGDTPVIAQAQAIVTNSKPEGFSQKEYLQGRANAL